jgi:protein arginine kinase
LVEAALKMPTFWSLNGPKNDVVLSSRIRLARNVKSLCFPGRFDESEIEYIRNSIKRFSAESIFSKNITHIDLSAMDGNEKRLLRERNIITSEMESSNECLLAVDETDDFTILVNDEDHFRIQVIRPGLQFMEAYRFSEKIDEQMNRFIMFAYADDRGYLTACPSNLGTGLKASAILHLPAVSMRNKISEFISVLKKAGAEIKGTVGEIKKTIGCMYQISNRISLGISEVDIIEIMDGLVNRAVEMEDGERDEMMSSDRIDLEDRVWKSYGFLKYARKINYVDAMDGLSNVRLGVILAVIKNMDILKINDIMVNIQWSHLQRNSGRMFKSTLEGDEYRAEYIRDNLA